MRNLRGENINGTDRSEHGAIVAATLLPMPKGGQAAGKINVPFIAHLVDYNRH